MKKVTIKNNEEAILEFKRSKFIAFSFFVKTKEEMLNILNKHKEKYKDATHNCHGYIIKKNIEEGFSDDGEPARTSGFPILEYLKNKNYEYTLVIVTRYFGGILLGTGGLVRAYGASAKEVLEKSGKYLVDEGYIFSFSCGYKDIEYIKIFLDKSNILIKEIKYEENVNLSILVFKNEFKKIKKQILKILKQNEEEFKYNLKEEIVRKEMN